MPEPIDKGTDCRKTYKTPKRRIRIMPRRLAVSPGKVYTLHAFHAPFECDPMCYRWYLPPDQGILSPLRGKSVSYRAPIIVKNVDCRWSATVILSIGKTHLDTAIFTINTYDDGGIAYERLSLTREIAYLSPHYEWPIPGVPSPPKGELSNHLRMYTWAYRYTCNDKLIGKSSWVTRDFMWNFNRYTEKWVLAYLVTGALFDSLPQAIAHYDIIDGKRAGDIIDRRSDKARKGGCCPLKLMVKALEEEEKDLPYY